MAERRTKRAPVQFPSRSQVAPDSVSGPAAGALAALRDLWSQALFAATAAEHEARCALERFAQRVEVDPDELAKRARELTERLTLERHDLELALEEGVRRALIRLHMPSVEEIASLQDRIQVLGRRVDQLQDRRSARVGAAAKDKPVIKDTKTAKGSRR